jgi:hypothetical protein
MNDTSDVMLPLDGTVFSGVTGEEVSVSGLLHIVTQVTMTVVCSEVRLHASLIGAGGTGKVTGERYVAGGAATVQQQIPLGDAPCPSFQVFFRVAPPVPVDPPEESRTIVLPVEIRTAVDAGGTLKAASAEVVGDPPVRSRHGGRRKSGGCGISVATRLDERTS